MSSNFSKKYFRELLCFSMAMGCSASLFGATCTPGPNTYCVTNNSDSGAGSLRQALFDANGSPGPNTIQFNIMGSPTIEIFTPLPPIRSNLTSIDLNGQGIILTDGGSNSSGLFVWHFASPSLTPNFTLLGNGGLLTVTTTSKGGDAFSSGGGGGALGAGGGIFVGPNANVELNNINFMSCQAIGGNGSGSTGSSGGGGGGMSQGSGGQPGSLSGGGGGGFAAAGGNGSADIAGLESGGGGGLAGFIGGNGFNSATGGGGGGGGDDGAGSDGSSTTGGNGGQGSPVPPGAPGGAGGGISTNGGMGTGNSGGGGGGPGSITMGSGGNAGSGLGGFGGTGSSGGGGGGGVGGGGGQDTGGAGGFSGGGGGGQATTGGAGGFGGGGGGGGMTGGLGGFGGGGGSGSVTPGMGGFEGGVGAGDGSMTQGGGGAGLGGAIFVANGATLKLVGSIQNMGSNMATGGTGANMGAGNGQDVFLMSSGTINFAPDAMSGFTIPSALESDNGEGGGSTTTGGIIMSGAGVLDLRGNVGAALPYTGSTAFNGGTTLISDDTNLGNTNNPISFDGGTLEISALLTLNMNRTTTLNSGGGTIQLVSIDVSIPGNITGPGGLTLTTLGGTGSLTLMNTNDYTGSTTINSGTLALSGSGSIADSSVVDIEGMGTFDISQTNSGATINDLSGNGGFVALGFQVLTLGTANSTTYGGVIQDGGIGGGTGGSIQKNGSGTLTLTGVNTYSGGTTVSGGTYQVTGSIVGPVNVNTSGATFDAENTFTIGDLNATTGSFVNIGTGKTLTVTTSMADAVAGIIQGGGALTVTGNNTLSVSAANTYAGGTTIDGGTFSITGMGSLNSTGFMNVNASGAAFDIQTATNPITIGDLSSVGGSNVNVGTNTLTFGTADSTTFSGSFNGSGHLVKQGTGTFNVDGTNTFTGIFDVNAGTLHMASSGFFPPTSTTNIASGATLTGTGTLGIVNLFGTVSPGDPIGTLHTGNFTFNSGSNYLLELSDTASDLVASSGTVTINPGATLTLAAGGALSMPMSSYTIITSALPIDKIGNFTLINPFPRFNFSVKYDPNDVMLILTSMNNFMAKGNAAGAVKCFNTLLSDLNPDLEAIVSILNMQTLSQWQNSFNQMQPANFNDIALAQENVAERIRQVYSRHFLEQKEIGCPAQQHWRFWAAPFVEWVDQSGEGDKKGYKENFAGFTTALDWQLKHWVVTGGFSYASADVDITGDKAKGNFNTYAGSVGAMWTGSGFFTDALFSYLYSSANAHRRMKFSVSLPDFSDSAKRKASHSQHSNEYMGHLGGGYDFKINHTRCHKFHLYPFLGADYLYIDQDGYTEHGADSLDLKVQGKSYDLLRPEAGLGFGYAGCCKKAKMLFDASVSYAREFRFLGKKTKASFEENKSCHFTVSGLNPKNNLVCPTASIGVASAKNAVSLTLTYYGEYGAHFVENAAEAEIKAAF